MKRIILILCFLFLITSPANAQMGMMGNLESDNVIEDNHSRDLDSIINEILTTQNVSNIDQINCQTLTEDQLEELGDSVMSTMHPNSVVHERMDAMMGGEGSESLKSAHILMAQDYLGCNYSQDVNSIPRGRWSMMGMMNYQDLGTTFKNLHQFDPTNWHYNLHLILINVTWLALIALIISATRYFWKKADKK